MSPDWQVLTSRNVWKCAFHLSKTWNIAKSRNKEWRQSNIGKTSNDARIITLKSNPSRGTALPAPHGKGNKCEFTRTRQIIRYRATAKKTKFNLRMLYPTDFTLGTLIIIDLQIIPSSRVIWNLLSKGHCQDYKHILTIKRPTLQQQNRESTEGY